MVGVRTRRASDANGDGVVSEREYVVNRIITDEAKAILAKMDEDADGRVAQKEFLGHVRPPDDLSEAVFNEFDTDGNGELVIPEYLRVWGRWARSGNTGRQDSSDGRNQEKAVFSPHGCWSAGDSSPMTDQDWREIRGEVRKRHARRRKA